MFYVQFIRISTCAFWNLLFEAGFMFMAIRLERGLALAVL
jgi:hypothetical protein